MGGGGQLGGVFGETGAPMGAMRSQRDQAPGVWVCVQPRQVEESRGGGGGRGEGTGGSCGEYEGSRKVMEVGAELEGRVWVRQGLSREGGSGRGGAAGEGTSPEPEGGAWLWAVRTLTGQAPPGPPRLPAQRPGNRITLSRLSAREGGTHEGQASVG